MTDFRKFTVLPVVVAAGMMMAACGTKKVAVQPPPPPAQPTAVAANRTAPTPAYTPRPATETTAPAETATNRYPDKATRDRIDVLLGRISDAYFDYDQHTLRPDAVTTLQTDSTELRDILKQYPDYKLVIEGHADERGSDEYNLGLGDARAKSAKDYLVNVGIPSTQLSIVSYGKDRPICTDHNESCWQKNRRIHIIAAANQAG
jgi:peptidoglycan-associated lipoprotein